jgi:endoglucanase
VSRAVAAVRARLAGLAVLAAATAACAAPGAPVPPTPLTSVPQARLAALTRGVNVTRWFKGFGRTPPFGRYLSDDDLAAIRNTGFRVVRLSVDPAYLHRRDDPAVLDSIVVPQLDGAIDRMLAQHLAVIVTPFLREDPVTDSASAARLARFWEALATHLARTDPDRVFLEVMNEPEFAGRPAAWLPLQRTILEAMRRAAPRHTLIATGALWSSIDGLLMVRPVGDQNVVYTFHFYEPHTFTHQNQPWASTAGLRNIPYPADSARCTAAVQRLTDSNAVRSAKAYCGRRWDAGVIAASLDRAAEWSRAHALPIFAGEFGVYCGAPREDRLAWIRDVREALDQRKIGWALWGWDDCFGLDARHDNNGGLELDNEVLTALGIG